MKLEALEAALLEAGRFVRVAKKARTRIKNNQYWEYGCKETAAAKRASMDLTRALAELRNPNH